MELLTKSEEEINKFQKQMDFGTSSSPSTFSMLFATIVKHLTKWKRYKANLISGFFQIIVMALVFSLFAEVTTFRGMELTYKQQFLFFYVGIILTTFTSSALWTPVNTVKSDLYNGTLEYIYSTPSSKYAYFLGTTIGDAIIRLIYVTPMVIFLIYYSDVGNNFIIFTVMVLVLSIFTMVSLGVIFATLAILYKQVESITSLIGTFMDFFAGAFIPLISLPSVFHYFALIFPQTYVFDLVRYYSMDGKWVTLFPVWLEWILMFVYFFLILGLTRILLDKVEDHAKESGLHLI